MPILSWFLLRGRCRTCGTRISARYPLIEGLTALTFAAIVLAHGLDRDLVWQLPLAAVLVSVAAIDLDHHIIPNKIVAPAAAWAIVSAVAIRSSDLPTLAAWGAGAVAFFLVAALAYPGGMGMGDVKLAGAMGLYLGSAVVPAMLIAFLGGTAYGLRIMAAEGMAGRKRGLPFGPFLAIGGLVALVAGPEIVDLYKDSFL